MPRSGISAVRARQLASRVPRTGGTTGVLLPRASAEQLIQSMSLRPAGKRSVKGDKKAPKYTCSECDLVVPQTEVKIESGLFFCAGCFSVRPAVCSDCTADVTQGHLQQLRDIHDGRGFVRVCEPCAARYLPGPGICRELCAHCRTLADFDVSREISVCTNCRHVWRNEHEYKLANTKRLPLGRLPAGRR